jgi:transposase-like protein
MIREAERTAAEVWRERLERHARSGASIAEFCRREGISPPSFYQWRKRLSVVQRAAERPRFVPVHRAEDSGSADGVEIELPGGVRVRLPAGASRELVTAAIEAAARAGREEAPC